MGDIRIQNNLGLFFTRHERAQAAGMIAAAQVIINAVKRGLTGGYTSGDFVTNNVRGSVTRSEPYAIAGGYGIQIGTNVKYALFWELGHYNLFTGRYERVEVWLPAFLNNLEAAMAAYARVYRRVMEGG